MPNFETQLVEEGDCNNDDDSGKILCYGKSDRSGSQSGGHGSLGMFEAEQDAAYEELN